MARHPVDKQAARRAAVFIALVASVLAGVWALPRVSAAAAGWLAAPVRERTVTIEGGLAVAARVTPSSDDQAADARRLDTARPPSAALRVRPGFTFDMVGLLCDGPTQAGVPVTVALRTSADGESWSEWCEVDLESRERLPADAADGPGAYTEPVWVGEARLLEARAEARAGGGALRGARLMFLNTSGTGTLADSAVTTVRSVVATIASLGSPPAARAMTSTPGIVRRAEWGADESWRGHDPEYAPVQMAFVHHTVNANAYTRSQAPGIVRGIYYYDTKGLKWSDLGYNFLVDRYGTIYEGRFGGITKGVIGAQTLGFNTGSTGVAMIGTFSTAKPPSVMMTALKKLLAWKLDVHHVDPQGQARMVCRATQKYAEGDTVVFPAVAGHRQANYTACPGDALYRLLPGVRTAVGGMGLPKIYDFDVGTIDVSPNGDAVQDSTRVRFRASAPADWRVEVVDDEGALVRLFSGSGTQVDVRWDCRDERGAVVPDGAYEVVGRAGVAGAKARAARAAVHVDTVAPVATEVRVTPAAFSPNGDGHADRCRLRFATAEACSARADVVDTAGAVLRGLGGWQGASAGARSIAWDGRLNSSGTLLDAPEGEALLRLRLKDAAGNRSEARTRAFVDRTLGFVTAAPTTLSPNGDGVKDWTAIGFTLTRRASVELEILRAGDVVRRLGAVAHAAGTPSLRWDGALADGSRAPSGTYRVRATATSVLGTIAAAREVTVDRYRPRLTAPVRVAPTLGQRARVFYTVRDPYSPKVRVRVTVRNRAGKTLAAIDCGWVAVDKRLAVAWKPPARRTYTLTLTAVDRGGNRQYAAAVTSIVVR